jgi:hypothetical protein
VRTASIIREYIPEDNSEHHAIHLMINTNYIFHICHQIIKIIGYMRMACWNQRDIENTNTGIICNKYDSRERLCLLQNMNTTQESQWNDSDWRVESCSTIAISKQLISPVLLVTKMSGDRVSIRDSTYCIYRGILWLRRSTDVHIVKTGLPNTNLSYPDQPLSTSTEHKQSTETNDCSLIHGQPHTHTSIQWSKTDVYMLMLNSGYLK